MNFCRGHFPLLEHFQKLLLHLLQNQRGKRELLGPFSHHLSEFPRERLLGLPQLQLFLLELQKPNDVLYAVDEKYVVVEELCLLALLLASQDLPVLVLLLLDGGVVDLLLQVSLLHHCPPEHGLVDLVGEGILAVDVQGGDLGEEDDDSPLDQIVVVSDLVEELELGGDMEGRILVSVELSVEAGGDVDVLVLGGELALSEGLDLLGFLQG